MRGHAKMANMRYWARLCLCIHLRIEKSMIILNKDDTLMPHVRSRHLDEGTKATRWKWLW